MNSHPFSELAEEATRLADRASVLQPEQFSEWRNDLRQFLGKIHSNNSPVSELAPYIVGDESLEIFKYNIGQLISFSKTVRADNRPQVAAILKKIHDSLERAGQTAASSVLPANRVPHKQEGGDFSGWSFCGESLGAGGQGDVTTVWHNEWRIKGALKRPTSKRARSSQGQDRFAREIEALRKANHPFVAQILDSGVNPEPFLVTELARFGSLEKCRAIYQSDIWRAMRMARDVALGLEKAHSLGIIHRDIKPSNILLSSLDHPLIADFGIAHFDEKSPLTKVGETVGSYYFAPREYERHKEPTFSFDVFSLGAVLYWALTGDNERSGPYRSRTTIAPVSDVIGKPAARQIDELIAKMMKDEPQDRYQSMSEVIFHMNEIIDAGISGRRSGNICARCSGGEYVSAGKLICGPSSGIKILKPDLDVEESFQNIADIYACRECGDVRGTIRDISTYLGSSTPPKGLHPMPSQLDLKAAFNAISDVVQNRPRPIRDFDQIYMKAGDMVLQSELVASWADKKRLAFIGDGDAISVCVAYLKNRDILEYGPSKIVVFDFDERIVQAVKRFADKARLDNLEAVLYNCLDAFPQSSKFDAFYTNPPWGASNGGESVNVFFQRGAEAIGYKGDGMLVIADDEGLEWPKLVLSTVQKFAIDHGFYVSKMMPRMHEYHLDDAPNLRSCNLMVSSAPGQYMFSSEAIVEKERLENFYGRNLVPQVRYVRERKKLDYGKAHDDEYTLEFLNKETAK